MVVVKELVSRRERVVRVHRVRPSQFLIHSVRHMPLPRAAPPALCERSGR